MRKPFIVLGSSLAFLMFQLFPLNLDCDPQNSQGKFSKETLKINEKTLRHLFVTLFNSKDLKN